MQSKFADVLEAVEELPVDEREMLIEILQQRLIENRRKALRSEIDEAKKEFENGICRPMTADEILKEVLP